MFLACAREGIACNPSLHRTFTCGEIGTLLRAAERPRAADRARLGRGSRARRSRCGPGRRRLAQGGLHAGDLPAPAANDAAPCGDPDKVAYLAFTSGTTGTPKCVMHSRQHAAGQRARPGARLEPRARHGAAQPVAAVASHRLGGRRAVAAGRLPVRDQRSAGRHDGARLDHRDRRHLRDGRADACHGRARPAEGARHRAAGHASRVFYMAGAPIPPSVAAGFVAQGIKPQNIYGMTENSSHQYTHPDDDTEISVTTCGRGGPGYEVRLFDPADRDRPVAVGEVGEIGGRGGALMLGYFDNQAATETSFNRDGWFMSGDLGVLDARGNLKVVGPLEGSDHPRRPQHLSGAHRGAGPAARAGGARRLLPGGRRAAGRARVHRRDRQRRGRRAARRTLAARASPSTTCRSSSCGSTSFR